MKNPFKKSVTVVDDTLRQNVCRQLNDDERLEYLRRFKKLLPGGVLVPVKDRRGHQVQTVIKAKKVFAGEHLRLTVKRAKRWMRSGNFPHTGAPRHIAIAVAAFQKAYPNDFEALARRVTV